MIRTRLGQRDRKRFGLFSQTSLTVLLSLLVLLLFRSNQPAYGISKELPMQVTVSDLASQPKQYDGHRVVVTGRVRSMEVQLGRRKPDLSLDKVDPAALGALHALLQEKQYVQDYQI